MCGVDGAGSLLIQFITFLLPPTSVQGRVVSTVPAHVVLRVHGETRITIEEEEEEEEEEDEEEEEEGQEGQEEGREDDLEEAGEDDGEDGGAGGEGGETDDVGCSKEVEGGEETRRIAEHTMTTSSPLPPSSRPCSPSSPSSSFSFLPPSSLPPSRRRHMIGGSSEAVDTLREMTVMRQSIIRALPPKVSERHRDTETQRHRVRDRVNTET